MSFFHLSFPFSLAFSPSVCVPPHEALFLPRRSLTVVVVPTRVSLLKAFPCDSMQMRQGHIDFASQFQVTIATDKVR